MYGLLISIGGISAFLLSEWAVKREQLNTAIFYKTVNWAIIGGVVGARFYHVLHYWEYYLTNPFLALAIWRGGLGIYGGLIGGTLAAYIVLKIHGEKVAKWLNSLILGIPLAQAIGRWGNYFNRELYGVKTALPWGWWINGEKRHPLFLYESVLCGLLFLLMLFLYKRVKSLPKGAIFLLYIGSYALIRFFLEFLRIGSWTLHGVNVAQAISVGIAIASLLGFIKIRNHTT